MWDKVKSIGQWVVLVSSLPLCAWIISFIGWFKAMNTGMQILYLIIFYQVVFDVGLILYIKNMNEKAKKIQKIYTKLYGDYNGNRGIVDQMDTANRIIANLENKFENLNMELLNIQNKIKNKNVNAS